MIAKYLATSLAMENVVSDPRVINNCLPTSTISINLVGFESRSTMLPASLAAWVPEFMATATSAWANAGASLVPSPVIATSRPSLWYWRINLSFASGVASARKSSTPASAAMAAAVRRLSPVIITVRIPMRRSSPNRSLMPPLTMSLSSTTPSTRPASLTTKGVLPLRATSSTACATCGGKVNPCDSMYLRMESAAPLRPSRSPRFTPLMRVCAENGTKVAFSCARLRSRRLKRCLASTTMLRPSGGSSASELNCAASASCCSVIPSAGMNAEAWRLPKVIVPVLSSSKTSTSPAASTARPEVAMTLEAIIRLMPATPMADSRPPMVVGMRQTSSATSVVMVTGAPSLATATLYRENGSKVAVASRNTSVRAMSKIVKAISFGVFCRLAPSTMAIIRSMNASPGFTVTRTTSQSDSTRVPPVTAEKSPPDSRTTGADSPVIALSSTEATPSTTSPSAGITSPVSTRKKSPLRSCGAGVAVHSVRYLTAFSFLALMDSFSPRRLAACALLRRSASASAKFANSTVNHSHAAIPNMKPAGASPWPRTACANMTVVKRLPMYTTNMTGLRTCTAGESLRNESAIAGPMSSESNNLRVLRTMPRPSANRVELQMLDHRPERERRNVGQRAHQHHGADQHRHEQRPVGGQSAGGRLDALLLGEGSCDGQHRNDEGKAPEPHGHGQQRVIERRVGRKAGEGAAVVVCHRRQGVENLRKAMRAGVEHPRLARLGHRRDRGADQHQERRHQNHDRGHFHFERLDLLADVFRRATDHQSRDEHGHDGEYQHAVETRSDAAEHHLAEFDQPHGHHAAERSERIVHGIGRAAGCRRGDGGEQRRGDHSQPRLLAFHVPAGLRHGRSLVNAQGCELRIALLFGLDRDRRHHDEDDRHSGEDGPSLARIADHAPKGEAQGGGNQQHRDHLQKIGQGRGILVRMRGIGVEKAAAIGTQHLDRLLRGDGAHAQGLGVRRQGLGNGFALGIFQRLPGGVEFGLGVRQGLHRGDVLVGVEVLDDPLAHENQPQEQRDRQQDI